MSMRELIRVKRIPIIIIFNECTINGTGDLSVEVEEPEAGESGSRGKTVYGLSDVVRKSMMAVFDMVGIATKEDVKRIGKRLEELEKSYS